MTKQEALKELGNLSIDYGTRTAEEIERLDEAVDMAIKALLADTVDRQTCEDAVSRQQAIDAVLRAEALVRAYGYRYAADAVRELPAVQSQPEEDCDTCKHGFFGSRQCDNCRVRYPSHYEREEEQNGSD